MPGKETTTKFKVDIAELKANIKEANRQIALANSKFKEASAGMDDWRKSTDGLSAKLKQLDTVTEEYKKILAELEKQYAEVAKEQGEDSAGAVELEIKMNKLKATIKNNEAAMSKYESTLDDVKNATKDVDGASDDAGGALDDLDQSARKTEGGFTVMKGAIASLVADGLKALASAAKDAMQEMMIEFDTAFDTFQAKTGTATAEMGEFEDQMNDIYLSGLGESMGDIANVMAEVKQQTGEVDPSKLKELSENAIVLRDTFDFDIPESMRAVNMLTKQFGITGEEAYNLIVQGAQNGLNKNGDLLDVINEYGVHYKQLGYTSEEFFNSLINGTASGTFSVDKLGDAMKEFGIRTKDTSETTTKGFEAIGLNAEEMRNEFAKGGESAKKATETTINALFNMDDQVKKNEAGVALFGTMWEDLGADGVKALTNTTGELNKTKQSMKEVTEIKMENVGTKFEQVGRKVKTELFMPLAEKLYPHVVKLVNYVINNSGKVVKTIETIGAILATIFVVNKVATFVKSISTLITTFKTLKTATTAATAAQTALNASQAASPWGWVALAIGAVVGGIVAYSAATKDATTADSEAYKEMQKLNEEISEQTEAYKQAKEARDKAVSGTEHEFGYYSQLVDELDTLLDKNGKVIEGNEARATFITTTLSEALGTEITLDSFIAEGKQNIIDKIDDLLLKQKAQVQLSQYEEAYADAVKNSSDALNTYMTAQKSAEQSAKDLAEAEVAAAKALEDYENATSARDKQKKYSVAKKAVEEVDKLTKAHKENTTALEDAESVYLGYQNTIENYEGVSSAIISGDAQQINDSLLLLTSDFKHAGNATRDILDQQVTDAEESLENMELAYKNGVPGVTKEMVDGAKKLVNLTKAELDNLPNVVNTSIGEVKIDVDELDKWINERSKNLPKHVGNALESDLKAQADTYMSYANAIETAYYQGLINISSETVSDMRSLVISAAQEYELYSGKTYDYGVTSSYDFAKGIEDGLPWVYQESAAVGDTVARGIESKAGTVQTATDKVGAAGISGISPYSATAQLTGEDITKSTATGMTSKAGDVKTAGDTLGAFGIAGMNPYVMTSLSTGTAMGDASATGMAGQAGAMKTAGDTVGAFGVSGIASWNPQAYLAGGGMIQESADGMESKAGIVQTAATNVAEEGKDSLESVDTESSGENFSKGFSNGILAKAHEAAMSAAKLADKAWKALKAGIKEGSPSKLTRRSGGYFGEGFVLGIYDWIGKVTKAAANMGDGAVESLTDSANGKIDAVRESISNISGAIIEEVEDKRKAFETELKKVEALHDFGIDDDATYYRKLEELRDSHLTQYSDKWVEVTKKIYGYQKQIIDDEKKSLQQSKKIYDDMADYAIKKLEEVEAKQTSFAKKLSDSSNLFDNITINAGDETTSFYKLHDFSDDIANAKKYRDLLLSTSQRMKASGASTEAVDSLIEHIESLGNGTEGVAYLEALSNASDAEFAKYMSDYSELLSVNATTAKDQFADDMKTAAEEAKDGMLDIMAKAGLEIPEEFKKSGTNSAQSFGNAFSEEIDKQLNGIGLKISQYFSNISLGIGSKITPSVGASFGAGLPSTGNAGKTSTITNNKTTVNHNYTQVINAPQPLKRVDIYRNTKNLLGLARG